MSRLLSDWIESYVECFKNTEPPPIFHRWCAISILSSALRRKVWYRPQPTDTFYPSFYIVLVAPPAIARKSTAIRYTRPFIDSLNIPMGADATTNEGLIQLIKNASATDITPENQTITHCSLTIHSSELTSLFGAAKNQSQLVTSLLDLYDCPLSWRYYTKTGGSEDITGAFVTILGATTPDTIRTSLSEDYVGGGMSSRILFIYSEGSHRRIPITIQQEDSSELYEKLLSDLSDIGAISGRFKGTMEFNETYARWYVDEDVNPATKVQWKVSNKALDLYASRRANHVIRLAIVLSASRNSSRVLEVEDFHRSISYIMEMEETLPLVFGSLGSGKENVQINKIMELLRKGPLTQNEISRILLYDGGIEVAASVINNLVNTKYITQGYNRYGEIEYSPTPALFERMRVKDVQKMEELVNERNKLGGTQLGNSE